MRVLAMRQRHLKRRGSGQTGGDAIDNLDLDAVRSQVIRLLAAATEDERIAPLEPHHALAGPRFAQHELLDKQLRRTLATAALAHMDDARRVPWRNAARLPRPDRRPAAAWRVGSRAVP